MDLQLAPPKMAFFPREIAILWKMLGTVLRDEGFPAEQNEAKRADFKWNYLYYLINREGVAEYVWGRLTDWECCPKSFQTSLKTQMEVSNVCKLRAIQQAIEVTKLLDAFGIRSLWVHHRIALTAGPEWQTSHLRLCIGVRDFPQAFQILTRDLYEGEFGLASRLAHAISPVDQVCLRRAKEKGKSRLTLTMASNFEDMFDGARHLKIGGCQLKLLDVNDLLIRYLERSQKKKNLRLKTLMRFSSLQKETRLSLLQTKLRENGLDKYYQYCKNACRRLAMEGEADADISFDLRALSSLEGLKQKPRHNPLSSRELVKRTVGTPYVGFRKTIRALSSFSAPGLKPTLGEYVPTAHPIVSQMLDRVGLKSGERLLDLGCGDGRVVIEAARRGAIAVGCEVDKALLKEAWSNALEAGVDGLVDFYLKKAEAMDLSNIDVVSMYTNHFGYGHVLQGVLDKLPSGARIVSHQDVFNSQFLADKTYAIKRSPHSLGFIQIWNIR